MKENYFLSQPHQPFFVLSFINATISMFLFIFFYKGILTVEILPKVYHSYSMIYLFFTSAFLGFLFTTFPRFSNTAPISQSNYLRVFGLFFVGSLSVVVGVFFSALIVVVGMVFVLIGQSIAGYILLSIYNNSPMQPQNKTDQFWILIAFAIGVVSHLFLILSVWKPSFYQVAIDMAIYLYLFLLTFTVAKRMVPIFSRCPIKPKKMKRYKTIVGLLIARVIFEMIIDHSSFFVDIVLAYLVAKELISWELPYPHIDPMVWILHLALFWIPVAFLLSSVTNVLALISDINFLHLDLHTIVLGFVFTMLIGFSTRVTMGHSNSIIRADRWTVVLFYWTQVVVLIRISTSLALSFEMESFFIFFDISVVVWLILFLLWAKRFFGALILKNR